MNDNPNLIWDSGFDLDGWRETISGSPTAVAIAGEFLWPEFAEIDSRVYPSVQGLSEAELRLAVAEQIASPAFNGDFDSLPEVDLSVDMSRDLFRGDDTDASTARVVAIVRVTWPLAAAHQFPGRTFRVRVLPADEDSGPMLTLIEDRH